MAEFVDFSGQPGIAGMQILKCISERRFSRICNSQMHWHMFCTYANVVFSSEGIVMLHYAVVFFVIALIAAVFGFTGIAAGAASIAKTLFLIFVVIAVISLILGLLRR